MKPQVKDEENPSIRNIHIQIRVDRTKGEFGSKISVYGYNNTKQLLDKVELIGLLQIILQQETNELFKQVRERDEADL